MLKVVAPHNANINIHVEFFHLNFLKFWDFFKCTNNYNKTNCVILENSVNVQKENTHLTFIDEQKANKSY